MARLTSILVALFALAFAAPAPAAFGDKDCGFGSLGYKAITGSFGVGISAVDEASGDVLVRMGFLSTGANLYRIDGSGNATDIAITNTSGLRDPWDTPLPDGRILFSTGVGLTVGPNASPPGVGRLLATGARDTTFGSAGYAVLGGLTGAATGPAVQADGRIVIGATVNGTAALVRFNADGSPDLTFGTGGAMLNPTAGSSYNSIALQPDGYIVAVSDTALSRHRPDGQLDVGFGVGGNTSVVGVITPLQVRLQPSGKILISGFSQGRLVRLARYGINGALDTSVSSGTGYRDFSVSGSSLGAYYTPYLPLSLLPDGRPVVVGSVMPANNGTPTTGALVRLGVELTDDSVTVLNLVPSSVSVMSTGHVMVGVAGGFHRFLGDANAATCFDTSVTLSTSPNPSRWNEPITFTAAVTSSTGVVSGGTVRFVHSGLEIAAPAPVVNGVATSVSSSYLGEGTLYLAAVYSGAGLFPASASPLHVHTVTPRISPQLSLSTSPNPSSAGEPVTLTVVVSSPSGTPTGDVYVNHVEGFDQTRLTLASGTATMVRTDLTRGSHTFYANYAGDDTFGYASQSNYRHAVAPSLSVNDPTGNSAASAPTIPFIVTLSAATTTPVSIDYATSDRSAIAGIDYTATSGTLVFNAGETSKTIAVPITQRTAPGPEKELFMALSHPTDKVTLSKGTSIGKIVYSAPGALTFHVDDPVVVEGYSGATLLAFAVSLSSATSSATPSVSYSTANGTAIADTDYVARSGTLTFGHQQTKRWVLVPVLANAVAQPNRTLFLNLSGAVGATVLKGQGTGTIVDDDPAPAAATAPMYRLFSNITKEHLFTTDANEYAVLPSFGWVPEGAAYTMLRDGGSYGSQYGIPFYRMYHAGIRQHHWTTDSVEVMSLADGGAWSYEGIVGYVLPTAVAGTTPLYRLSYFKPSLHHWTTDLNEKDVLFTQYGWAYEGIVGEVLPPPP